MKTSILLNTLVVCTVGASTFPAFSRIVPETSSAAAAPQASHSKSVAKPTKQSNTIDIQDAWIRATVPGQSGSGAFMKITSKTATRLVGVSTPVAGVAEVHEMKMQGDVMKMAPVAGGLELPAGKTVELKSGGYHVMLMDLKRTLAKDSTVPMTLRFKDAKGVESRLNISVPVSVTQPSMQPRDAAPAAEVRKH